ncbi:hypothetical protein TNCV_106831 [Trichonephila clavipes]|nr:hypothetical protein TNCV_106831 [Trichonephila clavipes]
MVITKFMASTIPTGNVWAQSASWCIMHGDELWSLETIGIRDPVDNLKERELYYEFIKWFEGSICLRKQSGDKIDCEVKELEELPIAAVGMESVPESTTKSEVPVDHSDQEVNPELTEITPVMDVCKFSRVWTTVVASSKWARIKTPSGLF